jgi:hypothetical protein
MLKIHVGKGEEVMNVATTFLAKRKIKEGAFVSIIGAVDECCVKNMTRKNSGKYTSKTYKESLELSGTGEVRDGVPHIHCVLGREDKSTITGHLEWARVTSWYVNLYLLAL